MTTENLHTDSLEDHIFTDKTGVELDSWLDSVGELLNDDEVDDVKATLIKELKDEFDRQIRIIKGAIRGTGSRETTEAFRDFCTDTLDDILADQDWDALATKILAKSHEYESTPAEDAQEWIAF